MNSSEIIIRKVKESDLPTLIDFFIKAYGKQTIFQNEKFLEYYFGFGKNKEPIFNYCLIGITLTGEIVSHYGGLYYELKMEDKIFPMIWGVSAYTLPEVRGLGINSTIVKYLIENNEINAVIGFTEKTGEFYEKRGYNLFNFERFARFVYVIDPVKTKEIIDFLKVEDIKILGLEKIESFDLVTVNSNEIIELTKENIGDYALDFNFIVKATTNRDIDFLRWRFLENPFIRYTVYGYVKNNKVLSYIALREENLEPHNYKVNRIIDLFGNRETINDLLNYAINQSKAANHIYLDFSMYGEIYEDELIKSSFIKLENEEVSILPQVTAPIETRENCEYLGLQSLKNADMIKQLTKQDVYFTRIDSDRDRIARMSQIK